MRSDTVLVSGLTKKSELKKLTKRLKLPKTINVAIGKFTPEDVKSTRGIVYYVKLKKTGKGVETTLLRDIRGLRAAAKPILVVDSNMLPTDAVNLGRMIERQLPNGIVVEGTEAATAIEELQSRTRSGPTTPRQIRDLLDLNQGELAAAVGVTRRTIQNWEAGRLSSAANRQLRDLRELCDTLQKYVRPEDTGEWLHTVNERLNGKSPLDYILDRRTRDLVIEFDRLRSGEPL